MNQLVSSASPAALSTTNLVPLTDRNLIITLLLHGVCWVEKYRAAMHKTIFYFDKEQAAPIIAIWQTGKAISVPDIRDVFKAESAFNSAVHDDL